MGKRNIKTKAFLADSVEKQKELPHSESAPEWVSELMLKKGGITTSKILDIRIFFPKQDCTSHIGKIQETARASKLKKANDLPFICSSVV